MPAPYRPNSPGGSHCPHAVHLNIFAASYLLSQASTHKMQYHRPLPNGRPVKPSARPHSAHSGSSAGLFSQLKYLVCHASMHKPQYQKPLLHRRPVKLACCPHSAQSGSHVGHRSKLRHIGSKGSAGDAGTDVFPIGFHDCSYIVQHWPQYHMPAP